MNIHHRLIGFSKLASLFLGGIFFVGCENSANAENPLPTKVQQTAECQEAKTGGPESVVQDLYKNYAWNVRRTISVDNEPNNVLLKYFDKNLTSLFIKNQECEAKEQGICNIDVDILYSAQDFEITDFRICAMDTDKHMVSVRFKNIGTPQVVRFKLSNTPAGWKVSDILYTWDTGSATLVEMLSQKMP